MPVQMSHSDLLSLPAAWLEGSLMFPPLLACFPPFLLLERFLLRDLNQDSWEEEEVVLLEELSFVMSLPSWSLDSLFGLALILCYSEIIKPPVNWDS